MSMAPWPPKELELAITPVLFWGAIFNPGQPQLPREMHWYNVVNSGKSFGLSKPSPPLILVNHWSLSIMKEHIVS